MKTPAHATRPTHLALTGLIVLVALATWMFLATPAAQALEVTQATAAPNEDGGTRILGGTSTRITWRAQADEGESLSSITISMSSDIELTPDDVRVTGLNDLERVDVDATVSLVENGILRIDFAEPTPEGLAYLVELYGTTFPAEGGTFTVSTTATLADGTEIDLGESGSIEVASLSLAEQISSWLSEQAWVEAWNSNTFLHMFFDPTLIVTSIPSVLSGWFTALAIVVIAFPLAIPIGFVLALMRMTTFWPVRALASIYVNVVRGTPLFLQIYIAFFGLPLLGLSVSNFVLGFCVMAFNSCAYLCEIFRAGIQSIDKGQFEASRSLGMSSAQTMMSVIIPQAFRHVIPTMTSELILLYKDTSLLAAVGIMETVMYARTITAATGNITPYIVAAGFYLIVTIPMSAITRRMEEKSSERRSGPRKKTGRWGLGAIVGRTKSWTPEVDTSKDKLTIKGPDNL